MIRSAEKGWGIRESESVQRKYFRSRLRYRLPGPRIRKIITSANLIYRDEPIIPMSSAGDQQPNIEATLSAAEKKVLKAFEGREDCRSI